MTLASGEIDSYLSRQQAFRVISGPVLRVGHVGQDVEVCYLLVPGDDVGGFHLGTEVMMIVRRLTNRNILFPSLSFFSWGELPICLWISTSSNIENRPSHC